MKARFAAVLILFAAAGCSADGHDARSTSPGSTAAPGADGDPTGSQPQGPTGVVGLQLVIPGDAQISTVTYTIAGPNGAATVVKKGSIDVHAAGGVAVQVTLAAASGYRIALSAGSVDGGVSCSGLANFGVAPRTTTKVSVQLACSSASSGAHTTLVNGQSFDCAAWGAVTASPAETAVGSSVALTATATGPIPANITYAWSAPSGGFAAPSQAITTFTCTEPGAIPVTLTVGDGPVPDGSSCNPALDTDVISVTCTGTAPPPPPAAPALPMGGLLALALGLAGLGARSASTRRRAGFSAR